MQRRSNGKRSIWDYERKRILSSDEVYSNKRIHNTIWKSPDKKKTENQIDHIAIEMEKPSIGSSLRRAVGNTGHILVRANTRIKHKNWMRPEIWKKRTARKLSK